MKRLVVTGIPCTTQAWENFLGTQENQRILSGYEILENSRSSDPQVMAEYVADLIESFGAESIVCHGMGVPLTLLALLRLSKQGKGSDIRVTIFNGTFRTSDVVRSRYSWRLQFSTLKQAARLAERSGGSIDWRLGKHISNIRKMYRRMLVRGLVEQTGEWLGLSEVLGTDQRFPLKAPVQLIYSTNDPFLNVKRLRTIEGYLATKRSVDLDYGHFPYTAPREQVLPLIEEFENEAANWPEPRHRILSSRLSQ